MTDNQKKLKEISELIAFSIWRNMPKDAVYTSKDFIEENSHYITEACEVYLATTLRNSEPFINFFTGRDKENVEALLFGREERRFLIQMGEYCKSKSPLDQDELDRFLDLLYGPEVKEPEEPEKHGLEQNFVVYKNGDFDIVDEDDDVPMGLSGTHFVRFGPYDGTDRLIDFLGLDQAHETLIEMIQA